MEQSEQKGCYHSISFRNLLLTVALACRFLLLLYIFDTHTHSLSLLHCFFNFTNLLSATSILAYLHTLFSSCSLSHSPSFSISFLFFSIYILFKMRFFPFSLLFSDPEKLLFFISKFFGIFFPSTSYWKESTYITKGT